MSKSQCFIEKSACELIQSKFRLTMHLKFLNKIGTDSTTNTKDFYNIIFYSIYRVESEKFFGTFDKVSWIGIFTNFLKDNKKIKIKN